MSYLLQFMVGAGVSWPAVLLGFWLAHRKTGQKIDRATAAQTRDLAAGLAAVTNAQTAALKDALGLEPPPGSPSRADPDSLA